MPTVIGVGVQDALAARPVVRGQLLAQLRILDRPADVPLAHQFAELEQARLLGHREPDGLVDPVDPGPHRRAGAGDVGEHLPHPLRDRVVRPGHHPRRGALVKLKRRNVLHDLGHDLDGAGAGADHRDALSGQIDAVVPLRGVENRTAGIRKSSSPSKSGISGMCSPPGAGDEELRDELAAVLREDVPTHFVVVPMRAVDMGVEPDVAAQPVLVRHSLQVVLDLRLERPHVRPVGLGLERERVHVRRDVAGAARDRCCRARCRRCRRPSPGSRSRRSAAAARCPSRGPENPEPMISARVCTGSAAVASACAAPPSCLRRPFLGTPVPGTLASVRIAAQGVNARGGRGVAPSG